MKTPLVFKAGILHSHQHSSPDPAFISKSKTLGEEIAIQHGRLQLAYPIGFPLWVHLGNKEIGIHQTRLFSPARHKDEYEFGYQFPYREDYEYIYTGLDPHENKRIVTLNSEIIFFDIPSLYTMEELQLCIEANAIIAILEHEHSQKFYTDFFKNFPTITYLIDHDPKRLVTKALVQLKKKASK